MGIIKEIKDTFRYQADLFNRTADLLAPEIERSVDAVINSLKNGNKFISFGNGGSAADAQHMVCELAGRFLKERESLNAVCLNTNVSSLTAIANDYGYDEVFVRQLKGICKKGDTVLGISTSGNSPNVLKAIEYANSMDCVTIGLTGRDGGRLGQIVSIHLNIPEQICPRIQELHIFTCHTICEWVEKKYFR